MIKDYKIQQLSENLRVYEGEEPSTLRGYVEREAENDPGFFGWLFDDGNIEGYSDLTEEQKKEYKKFINSL